MMTLQFIEMFRLLLFEKPLASNRKKNSSFSALWLNDQIPNRKPHKNKSHTKKKSSMTPMRPTDRCNHRQPAYIFSQFQMERSHEKNIQIKALKYRIIK